MNLSTFGFFDWDTIQQVTTESGLLSCPVSDAQPYAQPAEIAPGGIIFGVTGGTITDVGLVRTHLASRRGWGPACHPRIGLDTYQLPEPMRIQDDIAALFPMRSSANADARNGKLAEGELVTPIPSPLGEALWNSVRDQAESVVIAASAGQAIADFLDQQAMFEILSRRDLSPADKRQFQQAYLKQGDFRAAVERLQPICPISGLEDGREICRITPWHRASDPEKLDPNNALLLRTSLIDDFRLGMLHFEPDGYI